MDNHKKAQAFWLCFVGMFFTNAVKSIQVPFYPAVAAAKNVTPLEYGFVFSVYEMVKVAITPCMGAVMRAVGIKFMLYMGLFISGVSCCIFGFLDMIYSRDYFLVYSFLLRIMESVGATVFEIGSFSLVIAMYPSESGEKTGTLLGSIAFGYVLGPCFGGALHYIGGFILPFLVQGIALLFATVLAFKVIPETEMVKNTKNKGVTKQLLKSMDAWTGLYCVFAATYCTGFTFTTMEPHIRSFNLEPYAVSLVWLIDPILFALTSRPCGKLMDKGLKPFVLMLIGSILKIASFALFGPFPFIGFKKSIPLVVVSLGMNGLGNSTQYVSSLCQVLEASKTLDVSANVDRTSEVSVAYRFSLCLGLLVGTLAGGTFLDYWTVGVGTLSGLAIQIPVLLSVAWLGYSYCYGVNGRYNAMKT